MPKYSPQAFIDWVNEQMKKKNWSVRETARRAGISHTPISYILNGEAPSFDTAIALANVFEVSHVFVLNLAGLIKAPPEWSPTHDEWENLFDLLSPEDQQEMLEIARLKAAKKHRIEAKSPQRQLGSS